MLVMWHGHPAHAGGLAVGKRATTITGHRAAFKSQGPFARPVRLQCVVSSLAGSPALKHQHHCVCGGSRQILTEMQVLLAKAEARQRLVWIATFPCPEVHCGAVKS